LSTRAGASPDPNGAVSTLSTHSGATPAHNDGRTRRALACEQECGAEECRLGEHGVCGAGRKHGHERLVLGLGRPGEDVFEVERHRFDALQLGALGKGREA
jgi:hypothetical protein